MLSTWKTSLKCQRTAGIFSEKQRTLVLICQGVPFHFMRFFFFFLLIGTAMFYLIMMGIVRSIRNVIEFIFLQQERNFVYLVTVLPR